MTIDECIELLAYFNPQTHTVPFLSLLNILLIVWISPGYCRAKISR